MNAPTFDYKGHPAFHNQPLYSQFRESFENSTDTLFLALNELHPYYLRPEASLQNDDFVFRELRDPRTKQLVNTTLHDHSTETRQRPKVFRSNISSTLNKSQHVACLRVLQAWQQQEEVREMDVLIWRRMERKRLKENLKFKEFVTEFVQAKAEQVYAHTKRLVELYQRFYGAQSELLLEHNPEDVAYNTHAGLPNVRCCKGNAYSVVEINDVRLLKRMGWIPIAPDYIADSFYRLNANLQRFNDYFNLELRRRDTRKISFAHAADEYIKQTALADEAGMQSVYIPLDTLLFLLTAGRYPDLPAEAMLEIQYDEEESKKLIKFDEPFPARNCGPHTYNRVVENAMTAYWSRANEARWLSTNVEGHDVEAAQVVPEIDAIPKQQIPFEPIKFDDYPLEATQYPYEMVKTNDALIGWCLQDTQDMNTLHMYTKLSLPPTLDAHAASFMGGNFIKLEYKPEFGVEVMTEYQLVTAWLLLTFTQPLSTATAAEHYVKCMHVASEDMTVQLEEHLTLQAVEEQLLNIYNLKMPQMLAGLADFLNMLMSMPAGRYLLRYNDKYKDKFMLCAPTQEIKQTTVFLHRLLKHNVSDLCFMTQPYHLPISDSLCSVMHSFHKVMPGMFLPKLPHQRDKPAAGKAERKLCTDAEFVQRKISANKQQLKEKQKKWKCKKRAVKRKAQKARQQEQDTQLNKTLFEF